MAGPLTPALELNAEQGRLHPLLMLQRVLCKGKYGWLGHTGLLHERDNTLLASLEKGRA